MTVMTSSGAKSLYLQVIAGVVLGIVLGVIWPSVAVAMQPFGDAFIKLVRIGHVHRLGRGPSGAAR